MRRVPIPSLAGCGHSIVNLSGEFEPFPRAQLRFFDPSSLSLGTKVNPCLFVHRQPWVEAPPALPDKPWFQRRRIPRANEWVFTTSHLLSADSFGTAVGLEPISSVLETDVLTN